MKKIYALILLTLVTASATYAQLVISGEVRPRVELYNGNNAPKSNTDNIPGLAIQQRTRLTFTYNGTEETAGLKIVFSPQMINFWGQMPQAYDLIGAGTQGGPEGTLSVFEAYAQYALSDAFTLKFGRQAISYGDQRWFGALGWAASGRSHDAFVGKFKLGKSTLDIGLSLGRTSHGNSPAQVLGNGALRSGYKSLQYLWFEPSISESLKLPIMLTNITNQDSISASFASHSNVTTFGIMPQVIVSDELSFDASVYYQFSAESGVDLAASLFSLSATYKGLPIPLTLGADVVSGKKYDDTEATTKTWQQPFGTNHKFYGFMDFFYVGETRTEGLNDIFLKTVINTGDKSKLLVHFHNFSSNQEYLSKKDASATKAIGSEIDLIYNLNVSKGFNTKLGYSQFVASEDFDAVLGNDFNNWVWLQLTAKF